jgi:hypothetical protein
MGASSNYNTNLTATVDGVPIQTNAASSVYAATANNAPILFQPATTVAALALNGIPNGEIEILHFQVAPTTAGNRKVTISGDNPATALGTKSVVPEGCSVLLRGVTGPLYITSSFGATAPLPNCKYQIVQL